MILNPDRYISEDAFNYDLCKECAKEGKTCCQLYPCSYKLTDFIEFNESILIELLESNYAIIYYDKHGYGLRPRTDKDKEGSYMQTSKLIKGTCIFLSDEGCLLPISERPGIAINLIPKADVEVYDGDCRVVYICKIDEIYLQDPENSFSNYRWLFEKVLVEKGELWTSSYTGKVIFERPYGVGSHDYYEEFTYLTYNYLLNLCQGFLDSNLDNINLKDTFSFEFNANITYVDHDKENIYNLYLVPFAEKNRSIQANLGWIDLNLLKQLFGKDVDIICDKYPDLSGLNQYLKESSYGPNYSFPFSISMKYNTLCELCYGTGQREYVKK